MINIFIDTNIYITLLTSNKKMQLFEDLKVLVEHKIVNLIVPEVVVLELVKQNRTALADFDKTYADFDKGLNKLCQNLWSEARDCENTIKELIRNEKKLKKQLWERNYNNIMQFLQGNDVEFIELTPQIMCNARKRIIAGSAPRNNKVDQDLFNIESIVEFMNLDIVSNNDKLLICSNDIKDFSAMNKSDNLNGFYPIHPTLKDSLSDAKCTNSVRLMMKYINLQFNRLLDLCEASKEIDGINSMYDEIGDDEYLKSLGELDSKRYKQVQQLFEIKIADHPKEIKDSRKEYLNMIDQLLSKCRGTKAWSDKSELNLYNWLLNRTEEEIYISKLSDLINIKERLDEYYQVHLKDE